MGQILSSEVVSDRAQADGRRYVRMVFHAEDHDTGTRDVYVGPKLVASDFNATTWMASHEDNVLEELAREEDQGGLNMNAVADPLVYALNPKWSTSKRIAKAMIDELANNKDMRFAIYLKTITDYLNDPGNFTPTQLSNFLDRTLTQLAAMKRRVTAAHNTISEYADFDVEEGEF